MAITETPQSTSALERVWKFFNKRSEVVVDLDTATDRIKAMSDKLNTLINTPSSERPGGWHIVNNSVYQPVTENSPTLISEGIVGKLPVYTGFEYAGKKSGARITFKGVFDTKDGTFSPDSKLVQVESDQAMKKEGDIFSFNFSENGSICEIVIGDKMSPDSDIPDGAIVTIAETRLHDNIKGPTSGARIDLDIDMVGESLGTTDETPSIDYIQVADLTGAAAYVQEIRFGVPGGNLVLRKNQNGEYDVFETMSQDEEKPLGLNGSIVSQGARTYHVSAFNDEDSVLLHIEVGSNNHRVIKLPVVDIPNILSDAERLAESIVAK